MDWLFATILLSWRKNIYIYPHRFYIERHSKGYVQWKAFIAQLFVLFSLKWFNRIASHVTNANFFFLSFPSSLYSFPLSCYWRWNISVFTFQCSLSDWCTEGLFFFFFPQFNCNHRISTSFAHLNHQICYEMHFVCDSCNFIFVRIVSECARKK